MCNAPWEILKNIVLFVVWLWEITIRIVSFNFYFLVHFVPKYIADNRILLYFTLQTTQTVGFADVMWLLSINYCMNYMGQSTKYI